MIGHKLLMGDLPARKVTEWHKELGPILKVKMGTEDWVFISQADMAHNIFTWDENLTSKSPHFMCGDAVSGGTERYIDCLHVVECIKLNIKKALHF